MKRNLITRTLIIVAGLALSFGLFPLPVPNTRRNFRPTRPARFAPPRSPYSDTIAGDGIVESPTENFNIAAAVPGLILDVYVPDEEVGKLVKKGDPLVRIDDRSLKANLQLQQANLLTAKAQLARLLAQPRPEELPPLEARLHAAEAIVKERQDVLRRTEEIVPQHAATEQDLVIARQEYLNASRLAEQAKAELALTQTGAWKPDIEVTKAQVAAAKAQVHLTQTEIDRATVRAPVDGRVIQVNVRPGEFASAASGQTLMVLQAPSGLHVRVNIDERDIPRFSPGTSAKGFARGDASRAIPLSFVRVEPYVIPKTSLTGEPTELVDTRVLQAIYNVVDPKSRLYVGQQLDVFIQKGDVQDSS